MVPLLLSLTAAVALRRAYPDSFEDDDFDFESGQVRIPRPMSAPASPRFTTARNGMATPSDLATLTEELQGLGTSDYMGTALSWESVRLVALSDSTRTSRGWSTDLPPPTRLNSRRRSSAAARTRTRRATSRRSCSRRARATAATAVGACRARRAGSRRPVARREGPSEEEGAARRCPSRTSSPPTPPCRTTRASSVFVVVVVVEPSLPLSLSRSLCLCLSPLPPLPPTSYPHHPQSRSSCTSFHPPALLALAKRKAV